ncbi:Rv3654c family TadE-like protein, partial [Desertihabitans aurantiacus]|uniref:Rv3654c family TadE-like protein n=1 Tax=Desertihabitans aurantiacus TaxID=2282477 RepID=UPI0018E59FFB
RPVLPVRAAGRASSAGQPHDERGGGTGLTVAVLAVVLLVGGVVVGVGAAVLATAVTRDHADLAALAGARAVREGGDACTAAEQTARQNGARVLDCEVAGDEWQFVVTAEVAQPIGLEVGGRALELRAVAHAGSSELAGR